MLQTHKDVNKYLKHIGIWVNAKDSIKSKNMIMINYP